MSYFSKKSILSLAVLIIGVLVIGWQFPDIPQKLAFDEVEFTRVALGLRNQWVVYTPEATGHATPYFYLILTAFKLLGISVFSLRLPAAVFAAVNPLLVFLILKRYFKPGPSFLGALIFATSHWVFTFGRFAFEATYLLFWELVAIYSVLLFSQTKRYPFFALTIIATTLAFYSYLPGRIFFLVPLAILIGERTNRRMIVIFLAAILLLGAPLLISSRTLENRVTSLTYLNQPLSINTKVNYLVENVSRNLLMLNFEGDLNGRHNYPGKPGLNPFLGILFWGGLIISIRKPKKYRWVYWFMLLSVLGTLFTYPSENPHFLRTYSLTFGLVFMMTSALAQFWPKKRWLLGILLLLVILSSIYEVRTYFKYQTKVFKSAFESSPADLKQFKEP